MALESTAWSARCRAMVQISRSKAKSAFPTHSTWLSIQSTAIIIVALSGERRVGSVSRSIRKSRYRAALHWRRTEAPRHAIGIPMTPDPWSEFRLRSPALHGPLPIACTISASWPGGHFVGKHQPPRRLGGTACLSSGGHSRPTPLTPARRCSIKPTVSSSVLFSLFCSGGVSAALRCCCLKRFTLSVETSDLCCLSPHLCGERNVPSRSRSQHLQDVRLLPSVLQAASEV